MQSEKSKKLRSTDKNFFDESVITVDEDFIKYCSELRIAEAEKQIEAEILNKYSLMAKVTLEWRTEEDGRIKIGKILVNVSAETGEKTKEKLRNELTETYGAETEITFEEG